MTSSGFATLRKGLGLSHRWLFVPPVLLGVGVVVWLASAKKELPRNVEKSRALHVNVLQMAEADVFAEVTGFGTARALRTWTATVEVDGRVAKIRDRLRNGVAVEGGEFLVGIDSSDYEIRLEQRRAELVQVKTQLDRIRLQAKADKESLELQKQLLAVRKNDVRRLENLRRGIASSEAELDSAKAVWLQQALSVQNLESSLATYDAQIASAKASVVIAEANLKTAERDLERTNIRAPFSGILQGVSLEESQYVSPNQQLFEIIDNNSIEIVGQFSLAQLRRLMVRRAKVHESREENTDLLSRDWISKPLVARPTVGGSTADSWFANLKAHVTVQSGSFEAVFPAQVERITGTLDEQTRTLGVVVRVENVPQNGMSLLPGTYCQITLAASQATKAYVIPRNSIDLDTVFVVDDSNHLMRRTVEVAYAQEESVAVVGGLNDGDLVVLNPAASMRTGVLVETHVKNGLWTGTLPNGRTATLAASRATQAKSVDCAMESE